MRVVHDETHTRVVLGEGVPAIKIVPMGTGSQRISSQNYLLAAATAGITLPPWHWHICLT
jgi:hypothetical protein